MKIELAFWNTTVPLIRVVTKTWNYARRTTIIKLYRYSIMIYFDSTSPECIQNWVALKSKLKTTPNRYREGVTLYSFKKKWYHTKQSSDDQICIFFIEESVKKSFHKEFLYLQLKTLFLICLAIFVTCCMYRYQYYLLLLFKSYFI